MAHDKPGPELSLLIPVYNEGAILESSLRELVDARREAGTSFEVIVAENGSRDDTVRIAERLADEIPELRCFSFPEPNYGGALREAI